MTLPLIANLTSPYDFGAAGLGMAKVHAPPNTMVFPKVCEEDLYSCSYLKNGLKFLAGRM